MKRTSSPFTCIAISVALLSPGVVTSAQSPSSPSGSPAEVQSGSVSFEVATNIFSTIVRGESAAVEGGALVREDARGMRLEQLSAVVPVASLRTGLKKRDEHMREYIFQTAGGQTPDVRFSAEHAECSTGSAGRGSVCVASGELAIRGASRPFAITFKVTRDGDRFRVNGDGTIALSTYGIERPSQFGVKTDDEVKIHLELTARSGSKTSASIVARGR